MERKEYKIWVGPREFVTVKAICPSEAVKKTGHGRIWKIETADRKNKKEKE